MRMTPEQRRTVIVTAALRIARDKGLQSVNHSEVAKRCTVATSVKTVRHYFNDREALWMAVIDAEPDFAEKGREVGVPGC